MSDQFKALILDQKGEEFTREVKSIDKSFLKHGDVTIKVDYSDLNFKDGMILKNGGRLVKEFPHIPGIDFSGTVIESENSKFKEGDEVILTGFRVGEVFFGGYSQIAKVNADFLVKKPDSLTTKQAMILGTAGFTSLMSTFAICEYPPKKTSPTLKPVKITSSPSLNFEFSLSKTFPAKSIPGI